MNLHVVGEIELILSNKNQFHSEKNFTCIAIDLLYMY